MKNTHVLIMTQKRMPTTVEVNTEYTGWFDTPPQIDKTFSIHISDHVVITTPLVNNIVHKTNGDVLIETMRDVYTLKTLKDEG